MRPHIGAYELPYLDVGPLLATGVALFGDHGGALFQAMGGNVWEIHVAVLRSGRGEWAERAIGEAIGVMFETGRARRIVGNIPSGNLPCRALAKRLGFTMLGADAAGREVLRVQLDHSDWKALI